jgi:hypothetical protein
MIVHSDFDSIGGAEVVVKIMKTFPNCQTLQGMRARPCSNLAWCSVARQETIGSGGIKVYLCRYQQPRWFLQFLYRYACTLLCTAYGSVVAKENTGLLVVWTV